MTQKFGNSFLANGKTGQWVKISAFTAQSMVCETVKLFRFDSLLLLVRSKNDKGLAKPHVESVQEM